MTPDQQRSLNRVFSDSMMTKSPRERIQGYLDIISHPDYTFYDAQVLKKVKLLSVSNDGRLELEFTVTPNMCNSTGVLHGGCAATIMDMLTSMPPYIIAKPGFLDGGTVSRTLTCTYLRALPAGEKVKVVCEILNAGKRTCHMRGEILTQDGKVAVSCIHDKVARPKSKL